MMAALATASIATILIAFHYARESSKPKALRPSIPSPRETLIPHLTTVQANALAYSPSLLPGARDVETPYGTMRVYEWGPEKGKKVVLIHGDTTPGPMLAPIAEALVSRGCRVMIFDLWGRGYTDTPLDVPHDARLFGNQILFATASSSLSWTGAHSGGFSIIAFSLGGGIAMSFAACFPYLVNSIVLLAPGGILRYLPKEYETPFFRYPRLIPFSYLRRLVGNILGVTQSSVRAADLTAGEVKEHNELDIPAIVQWQFDHHKGFVHSFINTIAHGPLMFQHKDWKKVCDIITGKETGAGRANQTSNLFNSKLLVIMGDDDGVVVEADLSADLLNIIGDSEHVDLKVVPGGHGFPVSSSNDVVKYVCDFLDLPVIDTKTSA